MENKNIHSGFWSSMFKSKDDIPDNELIQQLPPFKYLDSKDINLLVSIIHDRNYLANEVIFCEGDPGIGLYIVKEGEVEIKSIDEFNRVTTFASLGKGDFFGELALVDGEKRSASAVAKSDVKLAVIFKPDLDEFIEKFPKKGIKILQGISQIIALRLRKMDKDIITVLSTQPYQEKLFTEDKSLK